MSLPPLPSAITVRNYRCFVEPTRLELRPITLLFGVNNSGKSALLRLLPLIADSSGQASPPLNLESPAGRGASFGDLQSKLVHETDVDRDLGIGLEWIVEGGVATYDASFHYVEEWKRLLVRSLTLAEQSEVYRFEWLFRPEERTESGLSYEWSTDTSPLRTMEVDFRGLYFLPELNSVRALDETGALPPFGAFQPRLKAIEKRVQWLEATRHLPKARLNLRPNRPRWLLQPNGEDAAEALAADPDLLAEVSSWYESVNQCALRVRDWPRDYFQLVLEHQRRARFEVDLADSGEGLAQLLPILTALALGRRAEQGGPRILAIEEPESHLHPELQMKLAEYLCRPNEGRPLPHLVLETHSEHFLLSVQLQIALGKLSPEDVVVYWVRQLEDGRSLADRVTFDENARPVGNSLPPGVFREDLEMARRILEARRARRKESAAT